MFQFLKDKLKKAIGKFSKDVEEESEIVEQPEEVPEKVTKEVKDTEEDLNKEPSAHAKLAKPTKKPTEETFEQEAIEEKPEDTIEEQSVDEPAEVVEDPEQVIEEEFVENEAVQKDAEVPEQESYQIDELEEEVKSFNEVDSEDDDAPDTALDETPVVKPTETQTQDITEPDIEIEDLKEEKEIQETVKPVKKGIFTRLKERVTTKKLSEKKFEDLFFELEIALLENNVAVEVIDKIKEDLRKNLVDTRIGMGKTEEVVFNTLSDSIKDLFQVTSFDLIEQAAKKKPLIVMFVGVNGVGKTTTIAKVAYLLQKNNLTSVMAAADTFRAAAIQQLAEHANNLNVKLIKHDYGSDPAAVAFDSIKYAKAKNIDVVLIDTAGRQHSNSNLMQEMEKMVRVSNPDLKIFVGESITGNDCVEQAKQFDNSIGIDGIILSKADVDEKGGAAVSVSYVTKKPIIYLGTGQEYDSLEPFDKKAILDNIGL